jgi:hypothetical protein
MDKELHAPRKKEKSSRLNHWFFVNQIQEKLKPSRYSGGNAALVAPTSKSLTSHVFYASPFHKIEIGSRGDASPS